MRLKHWLMIGLGLALDWGTKWWAVAALTSKGAVVVVPEWLSWYLTYNTGVAFSLPVPGGVLGVFIPLVVGYLLWMLVTQTLPEWERWGYSAVLCGAVGNGVDRLLDGAVVDMIAVGWWPVFNLADVWIVLGVVWLVGMSVWADRKAV